MISGALNRSGIASLGRLDAWYYLARAQALRGG